MPPNLLKRRTSELLGGATPLASAPPGEGGGSNRLFGLSPDFPKVIELPLAQIERNPDQPRKVFDPEEIASLAASIERVGQQNPILVRRLERDRYLLVGGERRIRACESLGRTTLYAIVTTGDPDEIALIDNVQRVDLNALELADALARLIERHQYTQEQVGAVIGRSQTEVAKLLSLRRLPAAIREAYWAAPDQVSRSALMTIASLETPEAQQQAWEQAAAGATVRDLRALKRAEAPPEKPREGKDLQQRFSVLLGRFQLTVSQVAAGRTSLDEADRQRLRALRQQIDQLLG